MSDLLAALARRVLVSDGAMGTMLHAEGHALNAPLAALSLSNPALVGAIHESYVDAGADIIQTNTFAASRHRLAACGYGDRVREINLASARIATEVKASAGRSVFVAGSISPVVTLGQRNRIVRQQRIDALREQIEALAEGAVDLLILETFGYLEELVEAVEVASELRHLPIVAQATFADDLRTFAGETPQEVAKTLSALPVAVIGANCTMGPSGLFGALKAMAECSALPLSAQPNAGLPDTTDAERSFFYQVDTEYFSAYARRFVGLGAAIVGGCCGTTPDSIRAVVRAVADLPPSGPTRSVPASAAGRDRARPTGTGPRHRGLGRRLAAGELIVAAEIAPPLGGLADDALDSIRDLPAGGVDQLFIGAARSARAQISALSFALHVQQNTGLRTTLTATTFDKSIMTLQADMLGASALGIDSVLCETGSPPLRGDYPNVDGIWEVDELALIDLLTRLDDGRDSDGLPLVAATSFTIGARCNPVAADFSTEVARSRARIKAGAHFLITRPLYEPDAIRRLISALAPTSVPVLVSIRPLRSAQEADFLRHEVPDVVIPDTALRRMQQAGSRAADVGIELAGELIDAVAPLAGGVVVTAGEDRVATIALLEQATALSALGRR